MKIKANINNIGIVLHKPRYPENIGSAARAAKNMGISRLIVVQPRDCDLTKILKMATHSAEDIIANMEVYDDLEEALGPFQYIVGTTARTGHQRPTIPDPRKLAQELIPISQNNQIALLFGPEDRGLSNNELKYCHVLVTIPAAEFSSLNLAQAVIIIAYEIFLASIDPPVSFIPRLANSFELEGMYKHLSETLAKIHFINPENPEYWMNNLRRFFSRLRLQARDVKIIRGICRQIDWYCEQCLKRALAEKEILDRQG